MNVTTYEEENEVRLSESDIDTANYEEVSEAIEAIGFLWDDSNENLLG